MRDFKQLLERAPQWREELERALNAHGGKDVAAAYSDVARAFPSTDPNPRSFDIPLIDLAALKKLAAEHGWRVTRASEMHATDGLAPVRFMRIAAS